MTPYRLPFNPLLVAIVARLGVDMPTVKFFSMVPQDTVRPYGEITDFRSTEDSFKEGHSEFVIHEIGIYSNGPSMVEANDLLGRGLQSLTREPILTLTDNWEIDWVRRDGEIQVLKEYDLIDLYFHGSFRLRWKIRDTLGG